MGLERILGLHLQSQHSPAGAVITVFQPPELWDNNFLLFNLPSLWPFLWHPQEMNIVLIPKRHRTVSKNLSVLGFSFPICKVAVWEWMMSGPLCSDTWWLILQKVHLISSKVTAVVFPNVALNTQQIHVFFFFFQFPLFFCSLRSHWWYFP